MEKDVSMFKSDIGKARAAIAKGKWRFIFWNGVLGWGVSTGLIFLLLQYLSGKAPSLHGLALNAVIWPVGGLIFGLIMWHYLNRVVAKAELG